MSMRLRVVLTLFTLAYVCGMVVRRYAFERNASWSHGLMVDLGSQGIFEHSTPVVLNVVVASFAGGNDSELIWMDAIECLCVGVAPWLPPIVTTRQSPQAEPPWWTHRSELRRRIRQFLSAA